jgi:hypothetical protein
LDNRQLFPAFGCFVGVFTRKRRSVFGTVTTDSTASDAAQIRRITLLFTIHYATAIFRRECLFDALLCLAYAMSVVGAQALVYIKSLNPKSEADVRLKNLPPVNVERFASISRCYAPHHPSDKFN